MSSTDPHPTEELDSPSDVLVFVRQRRADADRAEADVLLAAVTWAEQHPPESITLVATWPTGGYDTGLPLAGPGAPLVAEFCIAEFALAIGRSTDSGRAVIARAVELKYRLPRLWAHVLSGRLQPWRAGRIAENTTGLSMEAVAFVDAQVSGFAHKIGIAALERLVEEAMARFMPEEAQAKADQRADERHVTLHHDQVSFNGTTHVQADLDLADALDFDAAITQGAETLKACGSEDSLDVRRAKAVGDLARNQLALELGAEGAEGGEVSTGSTDVGGAEDSKGSTGVRRVVLYVHLSEAAISGTGSGIHLARVENTRAGVTAEQVKTWCGNLDAHVVVKPVIDLAEHIGTNSYEVPARLDEQGILINETCIFPWCTRSARRCDNEHCVPHDRGGTTCSCNVAPMCRRHHRLKTHGGWTYSVLERGTFLWTSPHGYQFLRDHTGTVDVSSDRRPRNLHPPEE